MRQYSSILMIGKSTPYDSPNIRDFEKIYSIEAILKQYVYRNTSKRCLIMSRNIEGCKIFRNVIPDAEIKEKFNMTCVNNFIEQQKKTH